MPESTGDADEPSLSRVEESCSGPSTFMVQRTEAASSSCTCWCFEISSFDVIAHAGSCSHLTQSVKVKDVLVKAIHVLCQTAAMLIPLPTSIASELAANSLALSFDQVRTFTCSTISGLRTNRLLINTIRNRGVFVRTGRTFPIWVVGTGKVTPVAGSPTHRCRL